MSIRSGDQLITYSDTALAAGALHQDIVGPGKNNLKEIWKALPANAEANIKFFVVMDHNDSASKIYYAANVHFANSSEKKLTVSATIGAYVQGFYCQKVLEEPESAPIESDLSLSNTGIRMGKSSSEVMVRRYPLISQFNEEAFESMQAKQRCPEALTIMLMMKKIFKDGVPLPSDQRFHYCTFTAMVRIPSQNIQELSAYRGTRAVNDPISVSSFVGSTCVKDANFKDSESTMLRELEQGFSKSRLEAQGKARPEGIPQDARQITGGTLSGSIIPSRSGSVPASGLQIEGSK